jgi:type IV/VI secretion system ImpK/VasF family protein
MSHAVWTIILNAWDRANVRCDRDLPPKASPASALGATRLGELRADLEAMLEGLERSLEAPVTKPGAKRIRFPLTLHLDELVLSRLVLADRLAWKRLQKDVLQSELGGEAFFISLDSLLGDSTEREPPITLQVYYFCLAREFRGRVDDSEIIETYKTRIRTRLERAGLEASPPSTSGANPSQPPPPPPRPPAFWYVVTAVAVIVILTLPIALSNL